MSSFIRSQPEAEEKSKTPNVISLISKPAISLSLKSSPCRWSEDRPCYTQRQGEDRACYTQRQAEDRPCYTQRQAEDRPCYTQRQAEDRPCYTQRQAEDRPCYTQRQAEDRPCYTQRQAEDRPCYTQRQAEDRPCYTQRQAEDRPCYTQRQAEDRPCYTQRQAEDRPCYTQRQPRETTNYTQLQPVVASDLSFGGLITSSTSVCLREDLAESSCPSDPVGSSCQPPPPLSRYEEALPMARTPESVDEEELTTLPEALQTGMTGSKGDDDDSSVMIDLTDLTFLDQFSMNEDSTGSSTWHDDPPLPSAAHLPGHHPSITPYNPAHQYHYYLPSSSSSSILSLNSTYSDASIRALTTPYKSSRYAPHHPAPAPIPTLLPWTLHYHDAPSIIHHDRAPSSFPPTPSPSPSQLLRDAKTCRDPPHPHHPHHHHHHHHHHHPPPPPPAALHSLSAMSTNDGDDNNELDDDDDPVYKPYCESRRGAKKNLLWKFLLTVLDSRSDLAQWTDLKRGVFKFVDTGSISKLWGQRKHKNDMTFEKLSRGIRHYYKRGLMERMSNTRLVYKFNWDKVPKKFRKA